MFSTLIPFDLPKKDDIINLEFLSDLHVGHVGFDENLFIHRRDAIIKDPLRYTCFMGDQVDAISAKDKRWEKQMVKIEGLDAQRDKWQKLVDPLVKVHLDNIQKNKTPKILWLLAGNHEYKVTDQDYIVNQFCDPNLITYLGSRGMIGIDIRYRGETLHRWKILAIHGGGGGTNPLSALDNMKVNHWADVYVMGHLHNKVIQSQSVIDFKFSVGHWVKREIIVANTGSFCDTYINGADGYMDRKNKVQPTKTGSITISFDGYQKKMHPHE